MQNLKHVGRMVGSNKKVLVAFRTLPGDAYSALVVATESLSDEYHNAIINLVEGPAAQESYELAEALDRAMFPDGSRMLPSLHSKGRLIKVATSQVEMTPTTSASILLSELNQMISEQRGIAVDELHVKPGTQDKNVEVKEIASVNTVSTPTKDAAAIEDTLSANASPEAQAKFYRSQADKLAKQAADMRRKAEDLSPTKKKTKEVV